MALEPIYFMIGQDVFKGSVNEGFLTHNLDEDINDAEPTVEIYDHQNAVATTYDTTPGSALSNTQSTADKLLIALDCKMVRDLLTGLHPSGFTMIKRTDQAALGGSVGGNRWGKSFGEKYLNLVAPEAALSTVIVGSGDTEDPRGAFLAFGYEEGVLGDPATDAAFKTELAQFILDIRTDYLKASAAIVLDFPPATAPGYTDAQNDSLANARKGIQEVSFADPLVSYINTDDLERIASGLEYTGEDTMELGRRMAAEMKLLIDGKGSVDGAGIPTYIMLGDEGVVGVVENTFLDTEGGEDYSGQIANSLIWNHSNLTWEILDGQSNSNTGADGTTKFGPDVAMVTRLIADKHLGSQVAIFKLGFNVSSLGNPLSVGGSWNKSDLDNYTTALDSWEIAKAAMFNVQGLVPDVRGIVWYQAEEDADTDTLAAAYRLNLAGLITSLRLDFNTRTETPMLIPRMIDTGKYDGPIVATIRQAQTDITNTDLDSLAALIDADGFVVNNNNQNLAGSAIHSMGEALAAAMQKF